MPKIIKLHFLKDFANNKQCEPFSPKSLQKMRKHLEQRIKNPQPIEYIEVKHIWVL